MPEIQTIAAVSGLGADLFLLNPNMSNLQLQEFTKKHKIDLFIADDELKEKISETVKTEKFLFFSDIKSLINRYLKTAIKLQRCKSGQIIVLTGGTSGQIKTAQRKPSILDFLNPFFALLTQLDLDKFNSVYIAVPIFHGFGFSTLIISLLLGTKIIITKKFSAKQSINLIKKHNIDVIAVVPLMIKRMLDISQDSLSEVKRIITGGAAISPELVKQTLLHTNDALFNLYGTSEAGFSVMATPEQLQSNPTTIGKPIRGVKLTIVDSSNGKKLPQGQVGTIQLRTRWAMSDKKNKAQITGDLGFADEQGLLYLVGRADDMIVSGGENVYPATVEKILYRHKAIEEAVVVGVKNEEFGERLKAFVVLKANSNLTSEDLKNWLRDKIARYEMPQTITILKKLPHTPVGKIDRKRLKTEYL